MATKTATATTKHTCGGPIFGRKTPGCPRCDELLAGAAPVRWTTHSYGYSADLRRSYEIRNHSCQASGCGVVCTFGDW